MNTKKHTVLIVEDDILINKLMEHLLIDEGYSVYTAFNGREGLEIFYKIKPDLVLSDIIMPYLDGYQLCSRIKSSEEFRLTPIILLTSLADNESKIRGSKAGADDFLIKPVNRYLLSARIKSLIKAKILNEKLDNSWNLLFSLAKIIEARDPYTEKHSVRVAQLAQYFGEELNFSEAELDILSKGGVLHDIGKVGIPDNILLKKGRLKDNEFEIMKSHTEIGYNICKDLNSLKEISNIVHSHHEKYDGSGYPQGLAKDEIPLFAQIISIADVYDALSSDRSYRKKFSDKEVIEIIISEKKKSFDPELVDIFIKKVIKRDKAL